MMNWKNDIKKIENKDNILNKYNYINSISRLKLFILLKELKL
jgi:hypothetical protein